MSTGNKIAPAFRVGDWVALLYGPRKVLAEVVEDRGRIGVRKRRLYRIRLDIGEGEPTMFEVPEEQLEATTEADREAWRTKGTIGVHQTVAYRGDRQDERGMPTPLHHYLIVAKPGPQPGSGVASIISLSEAKASGVAQGPSHTVVAQAGGPEGALAKAEQYLDGLHPGLKKVVGKRKG